MNGTRVDRHAVERRKRKELYSRSAEHQAVLDRKSHSPLEIRFKEIYGKWPSSTELQQAKRFLKLRPIDEQEE